MGENMREIIDRVLAEYPQFFWLPEEKRFQHSYGGKGAHQGCAMVERRPNGWYADLSKTPQLRFPDFGPALFDTPEQAIGYLLLQGVLYD